MRPKTGNLNHNYKKTPCAHWLQHQRCPYGARCQFAHGMDEIRCAAPVFDACEKASTNFGAPDGTLECIRACLLSDFPELRSPSVLTLYPPVSDAVGFYLPVKVACSDRSSNVLRFLVRRSGLYACRSNEVFQTESDFLFEMYAASAL